GRDELEAPAVVFDIEAPAQPAGLVGPRHDRAAVAQQERAGHAARPTQLVADALDRELAALPQPAELELGDRDPVALDAVALRERRQGHELQHARPLPRRPLSGRSAVRAAGTPAARAGSRSCGTPASTDRRSRT